MRGRRGQDGVGTVIMMITLSVGVLVAGLGVLRVAVASDLREGTVTAADAAALAAAVSTRDHLVAQWIVQGARTGRWGSLGGGEVGCSAARLFAARNSRSSLLDCGYLPGPGLVSVRVASRPAGTRDVAQARAVAALGAPTCTEVRSTTGHTQLVTRRCTGNARTAAQTWDVGTGAPVGPPDVPAWRALFHIRLVDEGAGTDVRCVRREETCENDGGQP